MKLNILLLFMCFSFGSLLGQDLSYDVSPVIVNNITADRFEGVGYANLTNNTNADRTIRWTRNVIEMTDTWTSAICDKIQCYSSTVSTEEFLLESDSTGRMDVHAYPNMTEGSAIIELVAQDVDDATVQSSNLYYFNADPTSTQEIKTVSVKVYPNPSNGLFAIKGGKGVAQVEVFSLAGTRVKSFTYGDGQWYDISDLPRGTYLVRLVDRNAQQLVTKLMNKL